MSFEKIFKLAEKFLIKVSEYHYSQHEPQSVKADELTWLNEEDRAYLAKMSKDWDNPLNPPPAVLDKHIWEKAKKAVKPYWKKQEEPYGTTMFVYRQMGGRLK